MNTTRKLLVGVGAVPFIVLGFITNAWATADSATVTAVSDASAGLKDTMIAVGGAVLPYAAAIVGLSVAWRFARKFLRG
jgi:hypothetical protein